MKFTLPFSNIVIGQGPDARVDAEGVQANFEAISMGDGVFPLGGIKKRSSSDTVTVTFPGGSTDSGSATVTHNFGVPPRVLAQVQDQAGIGGALTFISHSLNSFNVYASTLGFVPVAGTMTEITVLYWEE